MAAIPDKKEDGGLRMEKAGNIEVLPHGQWQGARYKVTGLHRYKGYGFGEKLSES